MSNWKKLFNKGYKSSSSSSSPLQSTVTPVDTPSPSVSLSNDHQQQQQSHYASSVKTSTTTASTKYSTDAEDSRESKKTVDMITNSTNNLSLSDQAPSDHEYTEPNVITKSLENTDPVMESEETSVSTMKLKPGLLTVKVYSSRDLQIPVPLKINKQILGKLANLGMNVNEEELLKRIESLSNNLEDVNNSGLSYYLPSTLRINNTNDSNKNVITSYNLVYAIIEVENSSERINSIGNTISNTKFNSVTTFDITSPNTANLRIHIYIRIPGSLLESDKQEDCLIGSLNFKLGAAKIYDNQQQIRILDHDWKKLVNPYTDEELLGSLNITLDFKPLSSMTKKYLAIEDFDLLKVIGKGSFGKVMQVRKKDTGKIYALKSIRKSHIVNKMEVTHTLAEKFVLSRVNSPFVVPLKFAFQSAEKLYLVLSFINGGELFYHLQKSRRFPLIRAKFYICELLSAIETLHSMNIVYRDLKPENILLDYQGHIALCDFGLCKINMKLDQKTNTFCGTPEYLAPELLMGKGYTRVVDFWTLGVLLYEMLTSLPPYYDEDVNVMYRKILNDPLVFPQDIDTNTKDIITRLLDRDPKKRLGYNGVEEIKSHPFFADIDWDKLNNKGYIPPYKPQVKDSTDISNISSEFTDERPMDSVVDDYLSESVQKQFGGWTYVGSSFADH
ncbi:hypothetical protein CANARDRAFT_27930 [[Candida] arabinofermentans NRRL YB-2248]|uniref:non-specific serine/threonine protein kinase n=1 Tax=[Candida] arabinofermentans NRRL YB-2248 TaxID=983967 RepID=A0A1E4T2C5_9ASCO|nr:hypothetical protein CANARDRAFT_27930 [[Candida] arabinofermentans NRRL YB-2248]